MSTHDVLGSSESDVTIAIAFKRMGLSRSELVANQERPYVYCLPIIGAPFLLHYASTLINNYTFDRVLLTAFSLVGISAKCKNVCVLATRNQLSRDMIWFVQSASVDDDKEAVVIEMQDSVELTFALKYLSNFSKVRGPSPAWHSSATKFWPSRHF
jgi:hypothetical protein